MTRNEARATEIAVLNLQRQLAQDPRLAAEVRRARRQFFGSVEADARARRGIADAAEHRFAEWFALERDSETLGAVPAEVPSFAEQTRDLLGSLVGVFTVTAVTDHGVDARDLQDQEVLELLVPEATLQPGDLLVGRLFPIDRGEWIPSSSAAVFRPGGDLGVAFERDVARLDLGRRLQQVELEHLLLRRTDQTPSPTAAMARAPLEHLEADLDRLLGNSGGKQSAAAVSQMLEAAAQPGPVMGPLLEELAFDTTVDLDRAREILLQIWNSYHAEDVVEPAESAEAESVPSGAALGEQLVQALDEGLAHKRPVEDLFAKLERIAGLEPGEADDEENPFDRDEEDDGPGADGVLGGDLGPLVQEYLWETGQEGSEVGPTLHMWVDLQGNAALPRTDIEQVTGQDLMRFLLHVYLGASPGSRAAEVRATFGKLQEFYAWAERTQEMQLQGALQDCKGALLDQLDRLATASSALSTSPDRSLRPVILQVEDLGPRGFGVRDDEGGDHWLETTAPAAAALRLGDLLLGALVPHGTGRALAGLVLVLPADARSLME